MSLLLRVRWNSGSSQATVTAAGAEERGKEELYPILSAGGKVFIFDICIWHEEEEEEEEEFNL